MLNIKVSKCLIELILKQLMIHNFNPGPAVLPDEVKEELAELVRGKNNSLSIIEISHRSKEFEKVLEETKVLIKEILELNDDYEVLILQGGASLGFLMVPINFLLDGQAAIYLNTGHWSQKAINEAKKVGEVISYPEKVTNFYELPNIDNLSVNKDRCAYIHFTSNNTIEGTMWRNFPDFSVPMVADMSSDIMGRKAPYSKFSLIYAGAQKNMGPAGATIYIIKKDFLQHAKKDIPNILNLNLHVAEKSLYNTPCVFAIYGVWLTMKWIKKNGGLDLISKRNEEKANLLYWELDNNPLFKPLVLNKEHRSIMNVTFFITKKELESEFEKMCTANGIIGIKGHRSVGGFRASLYNALRLDSVRVLVEVIREFSKKYG